MQKELEAFQKLINVVIEFFVPYSFSDEVRLTISFPQRDVHVISQRGAILK